MKFQKTLSLIVAFLLCSYCESYGKGDPKNATKKEQVNLSYKLKLGWFTLGSGQVTIDKNAMRIKDQSHHKVFAHTSTLGLGNWLSNLDDDYTSVINSKTSRSFSAYKNIKVGKSNWEQWSNFDYDSMKIRVKVKDHRKSPPDMNWMVEMDSSTYDVLGTFLLFKSIDWSKLTKGDSVMISTFYERKLYPIGVQYIGVDRISYNGNKINAHRLHLLLPHVENLKKDKPLIIWLSADGDQIPIRIQSKLFIGTARCELYTVNGSEPSFTKQ